MFCKRWSSEKLQLGREKFLLRQMRRSKISNEAFGVNGLTRLSTKLRAKTTGQCPNSTTYSHGFKRRFKTRHRKRLLCTPIGTALLELNKALVRPCEVGLNQVHENSYTSGERAAQPAFTPQPVSVQPAAHPGNQLCSIAQPASQPTPPAITLAPVGFAGINKILRKECTLHHAEAFCIAEECPALPSSSEE